MIPDKPFDDETSLGRSGYELNGKAALVTGGGSGIGKAVAQALAREGALVLVTDINGKAAAGVAEEIIRGGGNAIARAVDVTDRIAVGDMVASAVEHFGRLDLAINNAGIVVELAPIGTMNDEEWDRSVSVNFRAVRDCLSAELRVISAGGSIVNIASTAGLRGYPSRAPYVASKHGVVGLTKAAAIEYGDRGIRINAVCPGPISTPLTAHRPGAADREKSARRALPLKRLGQPEEVADAVIWLLSKRASFVTGIALPVDGGLCAT